MDDDTSSNMNERNKTKLKAQKTKLERESQNHLKFESGEEKSEKMRGTCGETCD